MRLPSMDGYGFAYEKFNRRTEDWAMVAVCALIGIKAMEQLPAAVFIIDPRKEKIAVAESSKRGSRHAAAARVVAGS